MRIQQAANAIPMHATNDMLRAQGFNVPEDDEDPVMDLAGWGITEPTEAEWNAAGYSVIGPF
jgi:hypothetical protein